MGKYDDIINLPHHVSENRLPMPMHKRAAQFAPFAALSGHSKAIRETARLTTERIELSADEKNIIDRKLAYALTRVREHPTITVTYFRPDPVKSGGAYLTATAPLKKLDEYSRKIILTDGTAIPFRDIRSLQSSIFDDIDL